MKTLFIILMFVPMMAWAQGAPDATVMVVGTTIQLSVDGGSGKPEEWTSLNPAIASVTADTGIVTGNQIGRTDVTVTQGALNGRIGIIVVVDTATGNKTPERMRPSSRVLRLK